MISEHIINVFLSNVFSLVTHSRVHATTHRTVKWGNMECFLTFATSVWKKKNSNIFFKQSKLEYSRSRSYLRFFFIQKIKFKKHEYSKFSSIGVTWKTEKQLHINVGVTWNKGTCLNYFIISSKFFIISSQFFIISS